MTTFNTAVWDAIKAPDARDLGGLGFATAEESWLAKCKPAIYQASMRKKSRYTSV